MTDCCVLGHHLTAYVHHFFHLYARHVHAQSAYAHPVLACVGFPAELERQVNLVALQQEIEAEAAEAKRRLAKAEKRKAKKSRKQEKLQEKQKQQVQQQQQVDEGNGSAPPGSSSSSSSGSDADRPQPKMLAAEPRHLQAGGAGNRKATDGKLNAQAAAYQRMLEEFGLDSESARIAEQLAAKQMLRHPVVKKGSRQVDKSSAAPKATLAPSSAPAVKARKAPAVVVVATKRPGSAPANGSSVSTAAGTGRVAS